MKDVVTKSATASYVCEFGWRSSTTGQLQSGIPYNGVTAYYIRQGAAAVAIGTISSTTEGHAYAGSDTNAAFTETGCPGVYQFHVPNNCCKTGVNNVKIVLKASGVLDKEINLSLIDADLRDGVRGGMTALPNAAAGATGGLPTANGTKLNQTVDLTAGQSIACSSLPSGTGAGQINLSGGAVALQADQAAQLTAIREGVENIPNAADNAAAAATAILVTPANRLATNAEGFVTSTNAGGWAELPPEERQAIADALLDQADGIEQGITVRQAMRIISAVLAGKVSGAGTGLECFTGLDGATPRVEVAADVAGNRTSVNYTAE